MDHLESLLGSIAPEDQKMARMLLDEIQNSEFLILIYVYQTDIYQLETQMYPQLRQAFPTSQPKLGQIFRT
jgi:hypothetical protein